jgi:hypothetical protein
MAGINRRVIETAAAAIFQSDGRCPAPGPGAFHSTMASGTIIKEQKIRTYQPPIARATVTAMARRAVWRFSMPGMTGNGIAVLVRRAA